MRTVPYYLAIPTNKNLEQAFSNFVWVKIMPEVGSVQIGLFAKNHETYVEGTEILKVPKYILMFYKLIDKISLGINLKSTAPTNKWDIYGVMPQGIDQDGDGKIDSEHWKSGTRMFRRLKKFIRSGQNINAQSEYKLMGPWSAKCIERNFPNLADKLFYVQVPIYDVNHNITGYQKTGSFRLPWIILGQNPEDLSKLDYDPSDNDVDNDVEIGEEILFPVSKEIGIK
jgi:hypothetical protein